MKHAPTVLLVLLATSLAACAANEHRTADSTESAMEKSDSGPADEARGADPDENSPQSEPEPAANCPVGTWLAGDDDLDDYFDSAALAMAKSMPSEAEVVTPTDADTEASGNLTITFRADHTYQVEIDKLVNAAPAVGYSSSFTGTETGKWTGDASAITMTSTGVTVEEATQTVGGKTQPMDPDLLGPNGGSGLSWGEFNIICEGSNLTSSSKGGAVLTIHAS